jgi:hypothetical protein
MLASVYRQYTHINIRWSCLSSPNQLHFLVLSFVIPLTYFLLLPHCHMVFTLVLLDMEDSVMPTSEYAQLPVSAPFAFAAIVNTLLISRLSQG